MSLFCLRLLVCAGVLAGCSGPSGAALGPVGGSTGAQTSSPEPDDGIDEVDSTGEIDSSTGAPDRTPADLGSGDTGDDGVECDSNACETTCEAWVTHDRGDYECQL